MHFRLLWMSETFLSSHLKIIANMYHYVVDSLSGPFLNFSCGVSKSHAKFYVCQSSLLLKECIRAIIFEDVRVSRNMGALLNHFFNVIIEKIIVIKLPNNHNQVTK